MTLLRGGLALLCGATAGLAGTASKPALPFTGWLITAPWPGAGLANFAGCEVGAPAGAWGALLDCALLLLLSLLPCRAASRLLSRPYTFTPDMPELAEGLTGRPLRAAESAVSSPSLRCFCRAGLTWLTNKKSAATQHTSLGPVHPIDL